MKFQRVIHSLLAITLLLLSPINQAVAINPGELAPEFTLLSADSKQISLSDYSGKVIYLDFWASWCAPCRSTLPWMNELQSKFSKDNFSVIAVNLDQNSEKAKQLVEELGLNIPILYDSQGKIAKLFELPAMPTSYLINQRGELVRSYLGFRDGDSKAIETSIGELLLQGTY
jgi:thiol-disulfide isomerase/thioredoxin